MSNYSKLIATLVAGALAFLANKFALPVEWATPDGDFVIGVTTLISSILVWAFPANKEI